MWWTAPVVTLQGHLCELEENWTEHPLKIPACPCLTLSGTKAKVSHVFIWKSGSGKNGFIGLNERVIWMIAAPNYSDMILKLCHEPFHNETENTYQLTSGRYVGISVMKIFCATHSSRSTCLYWCCLSLPPSHFFSLVFSRLFRVFQMAELVKFTHLAIFQ